MYDSLQKRYQINNSKVKSASSHLVGNEEIVGKTGGNLSPRKENFGTDRQERLPSNRQSSLKVSDNRNLPNSVAISRHMNTVQQKRKTLQKYHYINQLARLEYEDKSAEIYTKYTKISKASAIKKIKAKNQIAEFIEQQEDENEGFDELIQFKYGKEKSENYYFEKEQILQYQFCELCDQVHNDHPQAHSVICQKRRKQQPELYSPYSEQYTKASLKRINLVVQKIKSHQFQDLSTYLNDLQNIQSTSKSGIAQKKKYIFENIRQLKQTYCNDNIFVKIIAKVCYLIQKF